MVNCSIALNKISISLYIKKHRFEV